MGQKDITEKVLEDYNDVFADIINGLLFDGVQEIKPEALENTTVHAQYKAEDDKVHELERDIAKYWKEEKVELAICGIENQSKVEKNMPFRIIGYDGATYRSQLQQERKKMLPVVTIVLYFGTDRHWNSRKKIKELMEIPRCLDMYVNDYQMHVFEVAWLTEEQISHFRSDFKVVANFFVQKRKNKDYIPDDPTEIRHVDEVLKLLKVMTGDRRYEEIFRKKKEGVHSMCDVAERLEQMGIAKGIEIGRSEGRAEGKIEGKSFVAFHTWKQMAESGIHTLLLDTDLRKSVMAEKYQIEAENGKKLIGTSHVLSKDMPLKDAVWHTIMPQGDILPNVENLVNPAMLLESETFHRLLNEASEEYRYIFIDAPPLDLVSDGEKIGSLCDGAILVVASGKVSRGMVQNSIHQLERAGCPLLGIVLNRVEDQRKKNYYQKYGYYASEKGKKK